MNCDTSEEEHSENGVMTQYSNDENRDDTVDQKTIDTIVESNKKELLNDNIILWERIKSFIGM